MRAIKRKAGEIKCPVLFRAIAHTFVSNVAKCGSDSVGTNAGLGIYYLLFVTRTQLKGLQVKYSELTGFFFKRCAGS